MLTCCGETALASIVMRFRYAGADERRKAEPSRNRSRRRPMHPYMTPDQLLRIAAWYLAARQRLVADYYVREAVKELGG